MARNRLRILVVDDQEDWRKAAEETLLSELGPTALVDPAESHDKACDLLDTYRYDLAVLDIALLADPTSIRSPANRRLSSDILERMHSSVRNRNCATLLFTGFGPGSEVIEDLKQRYKIRHVLDKTSFDEHIFVERAQAAIFDSRLREAADRAEQRLCLTIRFNSGHLIASELKSAKIEVPYNLETPLLFDCEEAAEDADNLHFLFRAGPDVWRGKMRRIGNGLYSRLAVDHRIMVAPMIGGTLNSESSLWLRFSGPGEGLRIPFELLRDRQKYLCREHLVSRQLVHAGQFFPSKAEPFRSFVQELHSGGGRLNILLIAANCYGDLPGVDSEVKALESNFHDDLRHVGLRHNVRILAGEEATFDAVQEALKDGQYHIVHFAGHGRRNTAIADLSGLMLRDGSGTRPLTAAELSTAAKNRYLRLFFLSCCFGGYSAAQSGRGDFHGIFEALANADVPAIVGYRWAVEDRVAETFASSFYSSLWRTFSATDAVLQARRDCAREWGHDDETWASPILLLQSS